MADRLAQIEAALRAADAAGNTEDARRLAQAYAAERKAAARPDFGNVQSDASTVPADAGTIGRGIKLGARATMEGVAAIPDFLAGPVRYGVEKATGIPQTTFGDMASGLADRMGLPTPQTSGERVMTDVGRAISGTAATMGAGAALPSGSRLGALLTTQPVSQVVSSATGSASGGIARENGASPGSQLLASLAGGMAPGSAVSGSEGIAQWLLRGGEKGRQRVANTIADFASVGATPSVGQATGKWHTQGLESLLSGGPTSGGVMSRFAERQADQIGAGLGKRADDLSRNASAERAGRAAISGVRGEQGFIPATREVANKLYERVDRAIPSGARVNVEATKSALADLNASIEGAPNVAKFFQNARIRGIEDALTKDTGGIDAVLSRPGIREQADALRQRLTADAAAKESAYQQSVRSVEQRNAQARALGMNNMEPIPGRPAIQGKAEIDAQVNRALSKLVDNNLPYEALTKLRTLVGNEIDNYSLVDNVPRSKWKALYGALSKDMEAAASTPDAEAAWKRANGYYDARVKRLDAIDHVIERNGGPEKVYGAVMSGTQDGGTTLRAVMQSLPKDGQKAVTAAVIKRMGLATAGNQGVAGDTFSAATFLTNWNKVSPEARRALFDRYGPGFSASMDRIARVAENIKTGSKVFANPSGSANKIAGYGYWTGVAGSAAAAPFTGGAPLISLLVGGEFANAAARGMTNPKIVAFLARNAQKPIGSAVAELSILANSDPDAAALLDAIKTPPTQK